MPRETFGAHKSFKERIGELLGTKYRHGHAEPTKLIEHLISMADNTAQVWPKGTQYHNLFIVSVGQGPWDDCYSGNEKQSEAWIADALQEHIDAVGGLSGRVVVRLVLDPRLTGNVITVQNHFDKNALDEDETLELQAMTGKRAESANIDDTLYVLEGNGKMTAQEAVKAVESDDTDDGEIRSDDSPHAYVLFKGASYKIFAGETVGRRVPKRSLADVKLDGLGEKSPTSRIHCRFDCDDAGWLVTNIGKNGTTIRRADGSDDKVVLIDDMQARLHDRDTLMLGPDGPVVTFALGR